MLRTFLFSYLLLTVAQAIVQNNVCTKFTSYLSYATNKNCYYSEDAALTSVGLIKKYARNALEIHRIVSNDGYFTTVFRIRRDNPKGVALLQHSIATDSRLFFWNGNDSIAFQLWNDNYDVWLANYRGTSYSQSHSNLTTLDYEYWNFGVHEIAKFDVPAEIDYIRGKTNNSKIIFVGHSMGAIIGLIHSTIFPLESREFIKSYILIGCPAVFIHNRNILGRLLPYYSSIKGTVDHFQLGDVVHFLPILVPITKVFIRKLPWMIPVINCIVLIVVGWTPAQANPLFFNFESIYLFNDFSWQTVFHFAQLDIVRNRFQMYDYGIAANLRIYGSENPPLYPLENISVPINMISSKNDRLITEADVDFIFQQLPQLSGPSSHSHLVLSGLNHIDYFVGKNNYEFLYKFMKLINSI